MPIFGSTNQNKRPVSHKADRFLQCKIFFVILIKVYCFRFGRDPFAGIVLKLSAFSLRQNGAAFGAKYLVFINSDAIGTISAGSLNLFPENHNIYLPKQCISRLYNNCYRNATSFFIYLNAKQADYDGNYRNSIEIRRNMYTALNRKRIVLIYERQNYTDNAL